MQESLNYTDSQITWRSHKLKNNCLQFYLEKWSLEAPNFWWKTQENDLERWSWGVLEKPQFNNKNMILECLPTFCQSYIVMLRILVSNSAQKTNLNININNKKNDQTYPRAARLHIKMVFFDEIHLFLGRLSQRSRMGMVCSPAQPGWGYLIWRCWKKNYQNMSLFSLREPGFFEDPGWKQVDFLNYESWRPLCLVLGCWCLLITDENWLVVSTPLKNISQIGNLPQFSGWK